MPKVIDIDELLNLPMYVAYDEKTGSSTITSFRDTVQAFEEDRQRRIEQMREVRRVLQENNGLNLTLETTRKIDRILGF